MGFRKVALLTEIFALTAMSSVGFSSWLAIYSPSIEATGTVNVENITNQNDYMRINSMIFSEYDNTGFYTDFTIEGGTSETATLAVELEVNLEKCKVDLGDFTSLTFDFELSCKSTMLNPLNMATARSLSYQYIIGTEEHLSNPSPSTTYSNYIQYNSINITCSGSGTMYIFLYYYMDLTGKFSSFITLTQINDKKDDEGNVTEYVDDVIDFSLVAVIGGNG